MNDAHSWIEPLELSMTATLGKVNVYLVRGPGRAALVDTGMNDATSRRDLEAALGVRGLALRDIETLVCTHHHADHAGLGATLLEHGARVLMSEPDARSLELFFSSPDLDESRATFYGRHAVPADFAARVNHMFPLFRKMAQRFVPSGLLDESEPLDLAGHPFEVVLTPGHTMGHICLRSLEEPLFVTGDCVLAQHATHVSMRPETQGQDPLGAFLTSLARLADFKVALGLPGHGPVVLDLPARCHQLRALHEERLRAVLQALDGQPRSAFDISQEIMKPRPKVFAMWLALSQTLGYLGHLCSRELAAEVRGEDGGTGYVRATAGPRETASRVL